MSISSIIEFLNNRIDLFINKIAFKEKYATKVFTTIEVKVLKIESLT